ncbi:hypothetical protein K474DRAFT_1665177 [Panus rudis PR-1116 ss-1]|nr:hypothetical protein K474DRAFT_1665177 [Panus rudis PR-1116 ss-1]
MQGAEGGAVPAQSEAYSTMDDMLPKAKKLRTTREQHSHLTCSSPPRLNLDILLYLMDFLDCDRDPDLGVLSDTVHLMQTCRSLYRGGIPMLVKDASLVIDYCLDGPYLRDLYSFCEFMEADAGSRCRLMRSLFVNSRLSPAPGNWYSPYPTLLRLANVLKQCSNLTTLILHNQIPALFAFFKEIPKALGTLTSLRHVELASREDEGFLSYTTTAHTILSNIHSPLAVVSVDNGSMYRHDWDDLDDLILELTIPRFSSSLELLHVGHPLFMNGSFPECPKVKCLSIECPYPDTIEIYHFRTGFPNLQFLSLGTMTSESLAWFLEPVDEVAMDAPNNRMQLFWSSNRDYQRQHGSWDELDTVSGEIHTVYALALTCHVRHIDVSYFENDPSHFILWQSILDNTKPSAVSLDFNLSGDLRRLPFITSGSTSLTHMHLDICTDRSIFREEDFLDQLFELLRTTHLTYLYLKLLWSNMTEDDLNANDIDGMDLRKQYEVTGIWLASLNPYSLVSCIAASTHTLHYLGFGRKVMELSSVDDDPYHTDLKTFWEITRNENSNVSSLRQLTKEEKHEIKLREGMRGSNFYLWYDLGYPDFVTPYDELRPESRP